MFTRDGDYLEGVTPMPSSDSRDECSRLPLLAL